MDTTLTIERTIYALEKRFGGQIDLSDLKAGISAEERRKKELSRALAALAIMALSEADTNAAIDSITDGYDDLGLDAIYFDSIEKTLYVAQSKWSERGQKTIELGDCLKFLDGMRSLIHADFSNANDRLREREKEVREILMRTEAFVYLTNAGS